MNQKTVNCVLIGYGARGQLISNYARKNPASIKIIALAEPDRAKQNKFQIFHKVKDEFIFNSWEELFAKPRLSEACINTTGDSLHVASTLAALEKKYHVLLEKPMAVTPEDCVKIVKAKKKSGTILMIFHTLRYAPFFAKIKKIISAGVIGEIVSYEHKENISYWHMAHSFVRGKWRKKKETAPILLTKSCHDLDIINWLINKQCRLISSFGSLKYFNKKNKPKGAAKYCLDSCRHAENCAYYAPNQYLTDNTDWPTSDISFEKSYEARKNALKRGPYGRCVFDCDNDVLDHQVVNMEFDGGATAVFTLCAFTSKCVRTLKAMGTLGEIRGNMETIEVYNFLNKNLDTYDFGDSNLGHGGGDPELIKGFINAVTTGKDGLTSAEVSLDSHLIVFAAEEARLTSSVVNFKDYKKRILFG